METTTATNAVWHGTIDNSGRILIPVELRKKLSVEPGTPIVWSENEDGISLRTFEENIRHIQAIYKAASPPEDVWTESLYEDRRVDSQKEVAEMRNQADE